MTRRTTPNYFEVRFNVFVFLMNCLSKIARSRAQTVTSEPAARNDEGVAHVDQTVPLHVNDHLVIYSPRQFLPDEIQTLQPLAESGILDEL